MGETEKGRSRRSLIAPAAVASVLLFSPGAQADPASKVHTLEIEEGEVALELRGGEQWWRNNEEDRKRQFVGAIEYGVSSWWMTELEAGTTRLPNESYKLDEIEWENIFALTERGRYGLDFGLFAELARDHSEGRNVVEIGPMFQKEIDAFQGNFNIIFERQLGAHAEPGAEIDYEWQVKWRVNPRFEPGLQGFGTLGRTNDFGHAMEARIGPAFFGEVPAGRGKFKYDAAVLFGLNNNTPDTTLRFQIELEL